MTIALENKLKWEVQDGNVVSDTHTSGSAQFGRSSKGEDERVMRV